MKFAEHLTAHITPEWRKQYINYEVGFESDIFMKNSFNCIFFFAGNEGHVIHGRRGGALRR